MLAGHTFVFSEDTLRVMGGELELETLLFDLWLVVDVCLLFALACANLEGRVTTGLDDAKGRILGRPNDTTSLSCRISLNGSRSKMIVFVATYQVLGELQEVLRGQHGRL